MKATFCLSRRHAVAAALCLSLVNLASSFGQSPRQPASFHAVHVSDSFWSPKLAVFRERTIPHSWQFVTREIEDNEIAAGWKQLARGEDTPWNQANLHKVLETCAYALALHPDAALERKLDDIIRAIGGAQQPDGYVNALITARQIKPWSWMDGRHEGYVAGHLIEAAVAHHLATGKRNFLDIASKNADHIYRHFVVAGNSGVCGHAELEMALVRLYRVTGEKRYLALAQEWIERRGKSLPGQDPSRRFYFMDHLPIRQVPEVVGHAVRTMFYLTGVAEVAVETGDQGLQEAARRLWQDTTRRKMYLTGSVGSLAQDEAFGPAYELPNDGYCESCAACGLVYYAQAMFRLDGDSQSVDVLERTLYNAVLHGISLDGERTYYRNPLSDANHPRDNCWVCCPPCLSRTLLRLPDYVYATTGTDLYVNLYVGGNATATVGQTPVEVAQATRYPWQGQVTLTLSPAQPTVFALRLRIPGWCRSWTLAVNGVPVEKPEMAKGYAVLQRQWRKDEVVSLDLGMPVERIEARPEVKANNGRVAIQRGPLVYGFEGIDNDGGNVDITLPAEPRFSVEHRGDFLGGVTVIVGRAAAGNHVRAIPFYALANREPCRQAVWVAQERKDETDRAWDERLYRPLPPLPQEGTAPP